MAISTEKLLTLSQFQTGLQASKNYTDTKATELQTNINKKADQASLDETNGKVSTLETNLTTAQTDIEANEKAIADEVTRAKAAESANATAASKAQSAAEAADAKAAKAQEEVDALEIEVATVKGNVATNTGDISTMKGQISALEAGTYDDTEVRGLISTNAEDIAALEEAHATDKASLQEQIDANENAIALLTENLTTEEIDSVKELVDYVNEHGTEVSAMQSDISDNAEAIEGKADKATTLAGYGIADAYTKAEADNKYLTAITVATDEEVTSAVEAVFGA